MAKDGKSLRLVVRVSLEAAKRFGNDSVNANTCDECYQVVYMCE